MMMRLILQNGKILTISFREGEFNMSDANEQSGTAFGAPIGLLVMAFTDEKSADEAVKGMEEAMKKQRFYFENAAVVRQDAKGKVHIRETADMHGNQGAKIGALVGGVLGLLGGPAGAALGAGAGAAIGAVATHADEGFKNNNLKQVGQALKNGTSAVAAISNIPFLHSLQEQYSVEAVQSLLKDMQAAISTRLAEGKNVALDVVKVGSGLTVKEVSVGESLAEMTSKLVMHSA
jgi:uncharacterized membrane protein